MTSTKKDKNQQIQVFVRVRPLNKQEGSSNAVEIKNGRELSIKHHSSVKTYHFDRVFGPDSKQLDVYKMVAAPTVQEVIAGYNCTVLAYGQTGTGKTYTMAGGTVTEMNSANTKSAWFEDVHSGIIPRTLAHMFDELRVQQLEFTVRVSYLELYNEEIFDLLSPVEDSTKLKLYDDNMKKGSVIVHGLTETTVNTKSEVFRILEKGAEKRRIASTLMNSQSSRSHTVFCITVHTKENSIDGEDLLKTGKLYLVDLAGSENIKQSGATEIRAREAFNINQSLLTLGRCISKLIERSTHIPYRESKLTRLLQDSLGGRTKTTLIATVSPALCNADESINTLEYAHRAKSITNKPEINQRLSKKTLLKEYTEEIERLRKDLLANRMGKGIYLDEENYESLLREREAQKDEIAEKINLIRVMQDEMVSKELLCEQLKISLEQHQQEVEIKVHTIYNLEDQLSQASKEITDLQQLNELEQFIGEQYSETAEQLKSAASELITVADTSTVHERKLHDKLDVVTDINKHNKQICEKIFCEFNSKIAAINNHFQLFHDKEYTFHKGMCNIISGLEQNTTTFKENSQELVSAVSSLSDKVTTIKNGVVCNGETTRVDFELAQCSISQAVDAAKTNCRSNLDSSVNPSILKLIECANHQEEFVSKVTEEWKKMIKNHCVQVTEFVQSCKQLVSEASEAACERIGKQLEVCVTIDERISKQDEEHKSYQQTMAAQYKNIVESLQNMQADTERHGKASQQETMQCRQELLGLQQRLTEHRDVCVSDSSKTCDLIDRFTNTLKSTEEQHQLVFEATKEEGTNMKEALNENQSNVNKVLQEYVTVNDASLNDMENVCISQMINLNDQLTEQFSKQSSMLKNLGNKVSEVEADMVSGTTEFCDNVNTDVETMRVNVQANEKFCGEVEAVLSTELDNCRESVRKLCTSNKEYKTTGETPQRKFYRYPRSLVDPKPRDILIEEYHKVRSVSASRAADHNNEEKNQSTNEQRASSESNIPKALTESENNRPEVHSDVDKGPINEEKENGVSASSESNIPRPLTEKGNIRLESNTNRQNLREQNQKALIEDNK